MIPLQTVALFVGEIKHIKIKEIIWAIFHDL